jgi:hypothetical protein
VVSSRDNIVIGVVVVGAEFANNENRASGRVFGFLLASTSHDLAGMRAAVPIGLMPQKPAPPQKTHLT